MDFDSIQNSVHGVSKILITEEGIFKRSIPYLFDRETRSIVVLESFLSCCCGGWGSDFTQKVTINVIIVV